MEYNEMLYRLKDKIKKRNINKRALYELMDLTNGTYYRKLSGQSNINLRDIWALVDILKLSDSEIMRIFFCR